MKTEGDCLDAHYAPRGARDRVALGVVKTLRWFADAFFAQRYGHRAIVLETVAAVPGMVGGAFLHLRSLRRMQDDHGWIRTLLDEAENERMHLMTFIEVESPTPLERALVIAAQGVFWVFYSLIYLASPATAHRVVGYLEEEAVVSYTQYLRLIESGDMANPPAPRIAAEYWGLAPGARLSDVVRIIRQDEMRHREVNHCLADKIRGRRCETRAPQNAPPAMKAHLAQCEERPAP